MKKILSILLVGIMSISICACGKKIDPVSQKLMDDIASIGEITIEDEELIVKTKETYESLSDNQKEQVENYIDLLEAEETLEELKKQIAGELAEALLCYPDSSFKRMENIITISDYTTRENGSSFEYTFQNYNDFRDAINEYNQYLKENFELVYLDSDGNQVNEYTTGGTSFYYNSEDKKMINSDMENFTYTINIGTWEEK